MKKQLFCMILLVGSLFTGKAQDTCAGAVAVTVGSYTTGIVNGTYQAGCWETDGEFTEWYSYTATANGYYRINTNLPINDGVTYSDDTRVSVFSGTCGSLVCYAAADDVDDTNYLTDFSFAVAQGQTYYIAFDDRWSVDAFVFETTFTAASCFPVIGGLEFVGEATPTEVTISWDPPAVGTPVGYEVEYGEIGFTQGTGTTIETDVAQVTFEELTEGTEYEFYIRTDCGEGDYSDWTAAIGFTTPYGPTALPYAFGFEAAPLAGGWSASQTLPDGSPWEITPESPGDFEAYNGTQLAVAGAYGVPSDAWLYSRGFDLMANEEITITYYIAKAALVGAGNINNLEVTIGTEATAEGQTTSLAMFNDYSNTEYTLQTNTFTAPAAGVYYLGFNYTAPAHIQTNYGLILLDDVAIESALGVKGNNLLGFAVYPNPASEIINVVNADALNGIEIMDINGRVVKSLKLEGVTDTQVNVADLSAGVYIMNMTSQNGITVRKIIKE